MGQILLAMHVVGRDQKCVFQQLCCKQEQRKCFLCSGIACSISQCTIGAKYFYYPGLADVRLHHLGVLHHGRRGVAGSGSGTRLGHGSPMVRPVTTTILSPPMMADHMCLCYLRSIQV